MSVIKRKDGGWRIDVVIRRGKEQLRFKKAAKGARNRSEALAMERAFRASLEKKADPRAKVPLFDDFSADFLEKYARANNKDSEYESKRTIINLHLGPWFSGQRLDEIGPEGIEAYKASKLELGLVAKTVNNHLAVLSKLFNLAIEWGRLERAPRVKRLKMPAPEFTFFTQTESRKLIESSAGWSPMVAVALHTGLRIGELLGLRRQDVGPERLVVRQAIVRGKITTPKSHRPREVALNRTAREALAHAGAYTVPRDGYVFHDGAGKALSRGACKWPLWLACKRAGLPLVGWHVLRHSFASQLAMSGVAIRSIQELLGHADLKMTMRYAHLSPKVTEDAVRALDEDGTVAYGTGSQGPTADRSNGEGA